ncbi:hypothetical protein ACFQXA_18775 [Nocardiopsis composta]
MRLFAAREFSASLGAQTAGLFALGAVTFFTMQYLQMVIGLSPLAAGLWTVPGMLLGVAGNLLVPMLARRVAPGTVVTWAFAAAAGSMLLVAAAGTSGLALAVAGFTLLNLVLNPAMVLTYDLILTSAPPERAGAAAGAAETGNELGIALGVAITGSIGTAVYRRLLAGDALPDGVPPEAAASARDTLGGAVAAADGPRRDRRTPAGGRPGGVRPGDAGGDGTPRGAARRGRGHHRCPAPPPSPCRDPRGRGPGRAPGPGGGRLRRLRSPMGVSSRTAPPARSVAPTRGTARLVELRPARGAGPPR